MARLLADENFPFPVTVQLRALGHDVVTLEELGKSDQRFADRAVLDLAVEQERALLTLNRRHFVRLHGERPEHAGIVVCSLDVDFGRQAQRITDALEAVGPLERGSFGSTDLGDRRYAGRVLVALSGPSVNPAQPLVWCRKVRSLRAEWARSSSVPSQLQLAAQ